jgi:hypothetical protein
MPVVTISGNDPTPVIQTITPSTFEAGSVGVPVTITGSGFGTNPSIVISGNGVTADVDPNNPPSDTQISAYFNIDPNADPTVNVSVLSSGTATVNFAPAPGAQQQSNSKPVNVVTSGCPGCTYLQYRAFIRANWVQSPAGCLAGNDQVPYVPVPTPGSTPLLVRGDNRNFQWLPQNTPNPTLPNFPGGPPFRVYEPITISPLPGGGWTTSIGGNPGYQGVSREYDGDSLIADLTDIDPAGTGLIIDNSIVDTPKVCNGGKQLVEKEEIYPAQAQASTTVNPDGSVGTTFTGFGRDPNVFLSVLAQIYWNLTVTISADGSTASISGTHTCFPAHEVYTNSGRVLWQYGPNYGSGTNAGNASPYATAAPPSIADNDVILLSRCLLGGALGLPYIQVQNNISLK